MGATTTSAVDGERLALAVEQRVDIDLRDIGCACIRRLTASTARTLMPSWPTLCPPTVVHTHVIAQIKLVGW
jgi:hypothetical protein